MHRFPESFMKDRFYLLTFINFIFGDYIYSIFSFLSPYSNLLMPTICQFMISPFPSCYMCIHMHIHIAY